MDRPTTVLMADESELFLMGLRQTIEKTDAFKIVGQTTSGRESLAMVANVLPNILILDLVLPDIDGFELIETRDGYTCSGQNVSDLSSNDFWFLPRY